MHQRPCRLTIADKYYGGAPDIPQQNLGQELGQILQYLPKFIQKQAALSGKYGRVFAQQDIDRSKEFAPQYAGLGFDIAKQYGPQYQGLNLAQMQRSIAGQPLLSGLNTQAMAGLKSQGVDPLLSQLTDQAQSQLALGGQLGSGDLRNVTQNTLAGFAARGNAGGNQALAQTFLNRDIYSNQRRQQRQQFAGNVEQQRQAALGQAQQFGLGTQAANLAGLAGTGGLVNMPNLPAYAAPGASFQPMAAGIGATSGQANALLGFGSNLFDANQSAAANQAIGGANKMGGTLGAGIGAIGSIAGAAL